MDRRTFQLSTQVHGHYLAQIPPGAGPHPLLVGFHGYAENAETHLEALQRIAGATEWLLCAVQALHPFYNAKTGEVVASWMTRFNRELAIADNLGYVRRVVDSLRREFEVDDCLVYAGFSQGVAMAYRAAAAGPPAQGLIVLAGDVPPELAELDLAQLPPVLLGRGRRDAWYTEEKLSKDREFLARKGVELEVCRFDGGHEWSAEFLQEAAHYLRRARRRDDGNSTR